MNGLIKLGKFTPSKRPYAINRDAFTISHGLGYVDAIWAGRKNGRTTAAFGHLCGTAYPTLDEFMDKIDMRYGGDYAGLWDGETLITQRPMHLQRQGEMIAGLNAALRRFPEVPEWYDGWYYRR